MRFHSADTSSKLGIFSNEFIPSFDYGQGCKYSLFAQSIACVEWMRATWSDISGSLSPKVWASSTSDSFKFKEDPTQGCTIASKGRCTFAPVRNALETASVHSMYWTPVAKSV